MCFRDYDDETGHIEYLECDEYSKVADKLYAVEASVKDLLDGLYASDDVNMDVVESSISDLCSTLGIKVPQKRIHIPKKHPISLFDYGVVLSKHLTHTGV
jgi:hypothetical protein